jgi:hypothetical protein
MINRFHAPDVYVVVEEDRGMGITPIAAYASCARAQEERGSNCFIERVEVISECDLPSEVCVAWEEDQGMGETFIAVFLEDDEPEQVFGYEIATIPYFA